MFFRYFCIFLVSFVALVGIKSNEVVSYISPLYGDATSDKALFTILGLEILIELFENDDIIMSDRGFRLDLKHKHLILIHPLFLERKV